VGKRGTPEGEGGGGEGEGKKTVRQTALDLQRQEADRRKQK